MEAATLLQQMPHQQFHQVESFLRPESHLALRADPLRHHPRQSSFLLELSSKNFTELFHFSILNFLGPRKSMPGMIDAFQPHTKESAIIHTYIVGPLLMDTDNNVVIWPSYLQPQSHILASKF